MFTHGERVIEISTHRTGTTVWSEDGDMWGRFVAVEWDGPHSLIETIDVEHLARA